MIIHTKNPYNVLPVTEANSGCLGKNIIRCKEYLPEVSRSLLSQNGVHKFVKGFLNPSIILGSTAKLWIVAQLNCMLYEDHIFLFWTCHLLVSLLLHHLSLSLKNSSPFNHFPCGNWSACFHSLHLFQFSCIHFEMVRDLYEAFKMQEYLKCRGLYSGMISSALFSIPYLEFPNMWLVLCLLLDTEPRFSGKYNP